MNEITKQYIRFAILLNISLMTMIRVCKYEASGVKVTEYYTECMNQEYISGVKVNDIRADAVDNIKGIVVKDEPTCDVCTLDYNGVCPDEVCKQKVLKGEIDIT